MGDMVISDFAIKILPAFLTPMLSKLGSGVSDEIKSQFSDGLQKYLSSSYAHYLQVKTLLHRGDKKDLFDIYTNAKIQIDDATITVEVPSDLFTKASYMTLIGSAGSGKTMLVKYLFLKSVEKPFEDKIPMIVEFRRLNSDGVGIEKYIKNQIFGDSLAVSDSDMERLLHSGRFVFFFDGYDEINSSKKDGTTSELSEFVRKYPLNNYVVTSRPNTNIEYLSSFTNAHILDFDDEDIADFVNRQGMDKEFTANFLATVESEIKKQEHLSEFLRNPLLLSIYMMTFEMSPEVPNKRYKFYQEVFDVLYKRHDAASKIGYTREFRSGFGEDDFKELLKFFSIKTLFDARYEFDAEYLKNIFAEIKKTMKKPFEYDDMIYDLVTSLSIWVEDCGRYYFAHRSLQEYFAALYAKELDGKSKIYEKIVSRQKSLLASNRVFISVLEEIDELWFNRLFLKPLLEQILALEGQKELLFALCGGIGCTDFNGNWHMCYVYHAAFTSFIQECVFVETWEIIYCGNSLLLYQNYAEEFDNDCGDLFFQDATHEILFSGKDDEFWKVLLTDERCAKLNQLRISLEKRLIEVNSKIEEMENRQKESADWI